MPHPYSLTNVFGRVLDVFCAHKSQMTSRLDTPVPFIPAYGSV